MNILCTNDDGFLATGLRVLASASRSFGSVTIVAPDREQSATSHSLTMHHPLRSRRASDGTLVVDGTPTDCVILAVGALLEHRPDFCLSGINHGPNMGEDVLYSGTVAAAMEATVLGVPAIALSYGGAEFESIEGWEGKVSELLGLLLERRSEFPPSTLLNVNLPPIEPSQVKGVRITTLGKRTFSDSLTRSKDPTGREFFWIGGGAAHWEGGEETDFHAVAEGYISVTPLHLDLTNYRLLEALRGWNLHL